MGRRSSQGNKDQGVRDGDLPLDDLLEAKFDGDGRLAHIGRGARERVAERLEPRPAALNAAELERAVQKLAQGLEAIERQGSVRRVPGVPTPANGNAPSGAEQPAGREVVNSGLDRLEARLDALSRRLQQRLASVDERGAAAQGVDPRLESGLPEAQYQTSTTEPSRLAAVEPSLAVEPRRETPARVEATNEPQVTWGKLEPLGAAAPDAPAISPRPERSPQPLAAQAPSPGEPVVRLRPDLKQQFAALEARIASLQQGYGESQIKPIRDELVALLRNVDTLSREGRSIAGAVEQVRAKLEEVETKVGAARNMTGNRLGELQERLAGLSERLGEMESEVPGFEALRENQILLLEKFDRMEDLVGRIASPQELADRVEVLRTELQNVASNREVARIEAQILRIADRLDHLPEHLSERPVLERMEGQLQTLASEFAEARRQRSSGAGELNGKLAEIGEALHELGQTSRTPDLTPLERHLSDLTARLENDRRSSNEAFDRFEKRLAAIAEAVERQEEAASAEVLSGLTRKMDALAGAIHDQDARGTRRDLDGLGKKLEQLHDSLAEHSEHLSRGQARLIEERLDQLQGQLEASATRASETNAQLGPFAQKLQEISERLNGLGAADGAHPLSARLSAIEDHLAGLAHKSGETRALHAQLDNIVSRLEVLKGGVVNPAHLNTLVERVDAAVRAGVPEERFDRLEQKLAETAAGTSELEQKLESGLQVNIAEERFSRLEEKLEELGRAYANAVGGESLSPGDVAELSSDIVALRRELRSMPGAAEGQGDLGAVLKTISERLERLPESAPAANSEIEAQLERVAQLLEEPSHNQRALAHIENSLQSIEERLEETRRTVAARASAEDESGFEPQDIATVADLARGLSDDVTVLKSSAEASDKRTKDALDAVQSTLEAVVKRMAFLEREADAAAAAEQSSAQTEEPLAPIPAVLRRGEPLDQPVPGLAAEPEEPRQQQTAGGGLFSRLTPSQLLRRATGGRAESFSPDAEDTDEVTDLPLEPGTDSPLNSALTGAPSSDTVRMSGGRKRKLGLKGPVSETIAPARIAEPVTGEDFLAAARRAAQAAAAEAAGPSDMAEGESGVGRLVGRMKARRRAVLAGALALAVAFAALQFVRTQMGAEPVDLAAESAGGESEAAASVVDLPPAVVETAEAPDAAPAATVVAEAPEPVPAPTPDTPAAVVAETGAADSAQPEAGRPVRTVIVRAPTPEGVPAPAAAAPEPVPAPPPVGSPNTATPPEPGIGDLVAMNAPEPEAVTPPAALPEPAAEPTPAPAAPVVTASLDPASVDGSAPPASAPTAAPALQTAPVTGLPEPIGPQRLRDAALAGGPAAAFEVGARYAEGRGALQDMPAAIAWYEKAAEAGLAPAQYRLGSIYEKGFGVPKDLAKAQDWYRRAADAGNVKAMHNLAVLYAEGAGGEPNLESAGGLFQKAAEHGVRDSQFNLAILHARGLGVPQDLVEAYKWFAVAANSGDEESVKRRDIIAAAMNEGDLAKAKAAAEAFKPLPLASAANEIAMPEGGWGEDTSLQHLYSEADTVALVQQLLAEKGYDPGPADGMLGAKTIEAITAFQSEAGLPASGQIDPALVAKLQESST